MRRFGFIVYCSLKVKDPQNELVIQVKVVVESVCQDVGLSGVTGRGKVRKPLCFCSEAWRSFFFFFESFLAPPLNEASLDMHFTGTPPPLLDTRLEASAIS